MTKELYDLYREMGSQKKVASALGISRHKVRRALKKYKAISEDLPADILIKRRIEDFNRKKFFQESQKLIEIEIDSSLPFGIPFFGDPHIDCDGTDIGKLIEHMNIVNENKEFLLPICLGDVTNNWVGTMGHLYSQQSTSARDAITLGKFFASNLDWLAIILGNHDVWTRPNSFLEWMNEHLDCIIKPYDIKLKITTPNGDLIIFASHHFNGGGGIRHPAQGIAKYASTDCTADIYIAGHTHQSGYQFGWSSARNRYWHAVRVGSYKVYDEYANSKWLTKHLTFTCPVAIVDLTKKDPLNIIRWEWTPEEAVERLKWMRSKVLKR